MWLPVTLLSFAGFLGSLFAFVWLGCDRGGGLNRRGPRFLAAAALCFGLWLYALPRVPPPYSLDILKHYVTPPEVKGPVPPR